MGQVLIFVTIGLVLIALAVLGHIHAERRREALAAFAHQLGLRFSRTPEPDFDTWHSHGAFHIGSSRRAYNVLRGDLEMDGARFACVAGDYQYTTGSGKNRSTHRFSFLIIRPPWTPVPDLTIRPEHFGDKILGAIGFDDIDFESEEFSRRFMVKSADKQFAYAVVHPRMMEYLLQVSGPRIEFRDEECLFQAGSGPWGVEEFREHLAWSRRFFALWPEHLVRQLDGSEGRRA